MRSVNKEIVHGIPSGARYLEEGDIISIDVGACYSGYYGDAACTCSRDGERRAPEASGCHREPEKAISWRSLAIPGDLGHAVRLYRPHAFGLVRDYSGTASALICTNRPRSNYGRQDEITLKAGMTLAIGQW